MVQIRMWEKARSYIEGYLNQTHMEGLSIFENLLQQSKKHEYLSAKLSKYIAESKAVKEEAQNLAVGHNKRHSISVIVLRSIHSNNFTFLLAAQKLPVLDNSKYSYIVVVWPAAEQKVANWKQQLGLNVQLTVMEPYKIRREDSVNYLVVMLDNLIFQKGETWKEKPEVIKERANQLYKSQEYMQALVMYEFALCNQHEHINSRQRAILYGNSAACLFELRLFCSSIIFCDLAIKSDPKYPKGYIRRLIALLQLSEYELVPTCLLKLQSLLKKEEFEPYNERFTNYMANSMGIYNWTDIFRISDSKTQQPSASKQSTNFGDYHSNKIEIQKTDTGQAYIAKYDIYEHELILVDKPLVYVKIENESDNNFRIILDQIKRNCLLQKSFYETMKSCPPVTDSQENPQKEEQQFFEMNYNELNRKVSTASKLFTHPIHYLQSGSKVQKTFEENQLVEKISTSLFMERFLEELDENIGYGLWRDAFYFPFECDGNCSYVHLKNAFVVFATRSIKKGQKLTIDYLADVEALKRADILQKKYNRICNCIYCSLNKWPEKYTGDIEGLYKLIDGLKDVKTKKQMICQIIIKKAQAQSQEESSLFDSVFPGIIYKYIMFVEKDPHWEDILNLLRILRDQEDEQLSSSLLVCLMNCFNKYLKIPFSKTKAFLDKII